MEGGKWINPWKTESTMCNNQNCTELKMQDKSDGYSLKAKKEKKNQHYNKYV